MPTTKKLKELSEKEKTTVTKTGRSSIIKILNLDISKEKANAPRAADAATIGNPTSGPIITKGPTEAQSKPYIKRKQK